MQKDLAEEFIERRTYCCRNCHGNGIRLMTPAEQAEAAQRHSAKRIKALVAGKPDIGEFPAPGPYYQPQKPPNPDCPECGGKGIERTSLRDTRTLSPRGQAAFAGVRQVGRKAFIMFRENGILREVSAR